MNAPNRPYEGTEGDLDSGLAWRDLGKDEGPQAQGNENATVMKCDMVIGCLPE